MLGAARRADAAVSVGGLERPRYQCPGRADRRTRAAAARRARRAIDRRRRRAMTRRRVTQAAQDRRPRHRPVHAALPGPAGRHLRRLGRRQVDASVDDRRARPISTPLSWRWSANAAARCANSWRGRWPTTARRAVTVVSTGDESPMMRRLALASAMAVAEYFRDQGDVGAADRRFGHPLCPCGARRGARRRRAGRRPRLHTERLQRPAEDAGAGGAGPEGTGSITGVFCRAGRRRRS